MQKSNLIRKGRKGFTLVEVALAVAVGLIVIGGAIVGFNAVRENASNSAARQKVDAAVGIVENLASANNQIYPASNSTTPSLFSTTWKAQRTDWNANPWGGLATEGDTTVATNNGVTEFDAISFGLAADPATTTPAAAGPEFVVDATTNAITGKTVEANSGAGNIIYGTALPAGPWGRVVDQSDSSTKTVKGYVLSLYDKGGRPFWYVKGGK